MDYAGNDRTDGGITTAATTPRIRYACRVSGSACLIGLLLILFDGFGLPVVFAPIALLLAFGGALAFLLAKYLGLATGDVTVLDALLFTALFVVATCASLFTAVTYNHAPRVQNSADHTP